MTLIEELAATKQALALSEAATISARAESAELAAAKVTASNLALEISTLKTSLAAETAAKELAIADKVKAEKESADKIAGVETEVARKVLEQTAALGGKTVKLEVMGNTAPQTLTEKAQAAIAAQQNKL